MVEARKPLLNNNGERQQSQNLPARRNTCFNMCKVVVVGDAGVGKTAIISRFCNG